MGVGRQQTRLARRARAALVAAAVLAGLPAVEAGRALVTSNPAPAPRAPRAPLAFEANQGQLDPAVRFVGRLPGTTVHLGGASAALSLRRPAEPGPAAPAPPGPAAHARPGAARDVVRLRFVGARPAATAEGEERLRATAAHLVGPEEDWRVDIPTYARVRQHQVYRGVDVVWHGSTGELEYDLVVAPGADPGRVQVALDGAEKLALGAGGELEATLPGGARLTQRAPVAYQEVGGARRAVAARFVLHGSTVGFAVGPYDRTRPLVVDPVLVYSGYLGGGGNENVGDKGGAVAADAAGAVYVGGATESRDFATTPGALAKPLDDVQTDAFVMKLGPDGTLVYSAVFGGTGNDWVVGLAVDGTGAAYVTGGAAADFPVTPGAFRPSSPEGGAMVAKLDPSGSRLAYASYLSRATSDRGSQALGMAVAVDGAGNAYVVGVATSPKFFTTPGSYRRTTTSAQTATTSWPRSTPPEAPSSTPPTWDGGARPWSSPRWRPTRPGMPTWPATPGWASPPRKGRSSPIMPTFCACRG